MADDGESVRFQCTECGHGLRVPERIIGRRICCPFCQTIFESSFALTAPDETKLGVIAETKTEVIQGEQQPSLTRRTTELFRKSINRDRAKQAAAAVGKLAVKVTAPLAPYATGCASVLMPGAGEVASGKAWSGFATMAAFLGATAAAGATGGAWVAVPIAIRVVSAVRGAAAGKTAAEAVVKQMEDQHRLAKAAALQMELEAERLEDLEFERVMQQQEAEELMRLAADKSARAVVLSKVS